MVVDEHCRNLSSGNCRSAALPAGHATAAGAALPTCAAFAEQLVAKTCRAADCPELGGRMAEAMDAVLPLMPRILPYDQWMKTVEEPYRAYGDPGPESPVLVTGNFVDTITVLDEIFTAADVSLHLVIADTHGYSVDNAVEERWFKAGNVFAAMNTAGIVAPGSAHRAAHPRPGRGLPQRRQAGDPLAGRGGAGERLRDPALLGDARLSTGGRAGRTAKEASRMHHDR